MKQTPFVFFISDHAELCVEIANPMKRLPQPEDGKKMKFFHF